MNNREQQVKSLLKQVVAMDTQQAFDYLKTVDVDQKVVNQVALLLKPSETRTAFLQNQGLISDVMLQQDHQDLSGVKVENIQLLKPLGQGGMGAVYLGEDTNLKRQVAVKTLHKSHQISSVVQERFRREALILSQLDHPNICRIYQLIESEQSDYLVLELIHGETLNSKAIENLSKSKKFEVALNLLYALKAAHGKNIIHRDLKPDNIMLDKEGQAKILDFGISRLSTASKLSPATSNPDPQPVSHTVPGSILGTLTYMSPEQAAGEDVTTASDIYSLGLVFQGLFSKTPVYADGLTAEKLLKLSTAAETQVPVDLPHDLMQLIQRMKAKSPAERPTAVDAINILEKIQSKPVRRIRMFVGVLVLLAISFGIWKHISDLNFERKQSDLARAQAEQVTQFMTSIFKTSDPYFENAQEMTAIELLDKGALRIDKELSDQPEVHALMKATIGDVYHVLGSLDKANNLLQPAYQQIKTMNEVSDQTKSTVVYQYATLKMDLADYEQSEQLFREALSAIDDPDSEVALEIKNYLVLIYNRLNQFEKALKLTSEIINTYNQNPDYDINIALNAMNSEGMINHQLGDFEQAEQNFKTAIALAEQSSGVDYSTESNLMGNLAGVYLATDRQQESLLIRQQVVELSEQRLPENHPDLIGAYDNLAVDYYFLEDLEQAIYWNKKSLDVFENLTKENSNQSDNFIYSYSMTLANYAVLLTRSDNYREANKVFAQVVDNLTQILGKEHKLVADYTYELGKTHFNLDEMAQAEQLTNEAISIYDSISVPLSLREVKTWLLKASILNHQGQLNALSQLESELRQKVNKLDPPNEQMLNLVNEKFESFKSNQ